MQGDGNAGSERSEAAADEHRAQVGSTVYVLIGLVAGCLLPLLAMLGADFIGGGHADSGGTGPVGPSKRQQLVAANNRAVATMYHFERERDFPRAYEMFTDILQDHPDDLDVQVNRAIARLNMDAEGVAEEAIEILGSVVAQQPDHLRARYTLALLLKDVDVDSAVEHAQFVAQHDPDDPYAAYLAGLTLYVRNGPEDLDRARTYLERALALSPQLLSTYETLALVLQRQGDDDRAAQLRAEFERVKGETVQASKFRIFNDRKYSLMGPKAEVIPLESQQGQPMALNEGRLLLPAEPLRIRGRVQWRSFEAGEADPPTASFCDLDGDGLLDIFIASGGADPPNVVLMHQIGGDFFVDRDNPLAAFEGTRAAVWGDFDNDDLTDCYLVCRGGNRLLRQVERGRWQDVTDKSGAAGQGEVVDAVAFDADHDGDLDLYLVRRDGPNILLSNNLDGTFRDVTDEAGVGGDGRPSIAAIVADLDGDRDADIAIIHAAPPHELFYNELLWKYRSAPPAEDWRASPIDAAVAADVDVDGQVELYTLGGGELARWSRGQPTGWQRDVLATGVVGDRVGRQRLALADLDGDGLPEAFAGGPNAWRSYALVEGQATVDSTDNSAFGAWSLGYTEPTHGPCVLGLASGGPPIRWIGGGAQHMFIGLDLVGHLTPKWQTKSNSSGIGATISAQIGTRRVGSTSYRLQSGPGQSLEPVVLGVGSDLAADYVTIYWSSLVRQTEANLECGEIRRIVEENRLPISCPLVLAWNGREFEFVTDMLGVGGLGYFVRPGESAPPDPTESLLLPAGLPQSRDGGYEIQVAEAGEETTYLDELRLVAYDLPPGWQVTVDERLGLAAPLPTGRALFFRDEASPARATDDRGADVLAEISLADRIAAPPGTPDRRFIGRTAPHALTLAFDEPLDRHAGQPLLLVDAWIEFPFSSTLFAAWQAGAEFQAPTVEARAPGGTWQVVLERFGLPDGMPRHLAVPLSGLPAGTTELRISTNHEIYWDRLAVAWAEDCPQVQRAECPLRAARLEYAGFPARTLGPQKAPRFDYAAAVPAVACGRQLGCYTKFGPVEELLQAADSALVVMGPGERVTASFTAPTGDPPVGCTRRVVLEAVGWSKDLDPYTEYGRTIEPVPLFGSPDADALRRRDELHRRYNTRLEVDL